MLTEPLLVQILEQLQCIDSVFADVCREGTYRPSAAELDTLVKIEECLFTGRMLAGLLILDARGQDGQADGV